MDSNPNDMPPLGWVYARVQDQRTPKLGNPIGWEQGFEPQTFTLRSNSNYDNMKWRANMASLPCRILWVPTQENISPSTWNQISRLDPILNPKVRSISECLEPQFLGPGSDRNPTLGSLYTQTKGHDYVIVKNLLVWSWTVSTISTNERSYKPNGHKPRVVTMKLWGAQRKCHEASSSVVMDPSSAV